MLTRRVALPLAALTAFATLPVLAGTAPAGASGSVMKPSPLARGGGENGDPEGPSAKNQEKKDNCPTDMWTVPLEVKGLACILLLPKPEKQNGEEESGGGGLGDLLG
ncbi:MAG: hypothetical protein AB1679_27835 [Actinomycetota bacterium]|jgi:hypothetical protein